MRTATNQQPDWISRFARHRVAPNLLMAMMVLAGIFALNRLQTQFFPDFQAEIIFTQVIWAGATPEDIDEAITSPLETELRDVANLKKMTSSSNLGAGVVVLEFEPGTKMGPALDDVKERVSRVRNLPADAEDPSVTLMSDNDVTRSRMVSRLLISGPSNREDLRPLAHRLEQELLDAGVGSVTINGLPDQEISIEVPSAQLLALGLTVEQLGQQLAAQSVDVPAGTAGSADIARQLRSLDRQRNAHDFAKLPLIANSNGQRLSVGDVGSVLLQPRDNQITLEYNGKPAVEFEVFSGKTQGVLDAADILNQWLETTRPQLPPGFELVTYDEQWAPLQERIDLLLENGAGGLLLILAILFLFLNGRVAFWVAMGIPASIMATLGLLWLFGGSINMLSLFGMIMALGVIVDDAIVVGEDAFAHYQNGEDPIAAAEGGARRMLAPVASASITTIAAFIPLMTVSGIMGAIMFAIPLVVICVVLASLFECFAILPGHLHHSFKKIDKREEGPLRRRIDAGFNRFRDGPFRSLITWVVHNKTITLFSALACLILSFGLLAGKRVEFNFFPTPEVPVVLANVQFAAGTPKDRVNDYVKHLHTALEQAQQELDEDIVVLAVDIFGWMAEGGFSGSQGEQYALVRVQLTEPDQRSIRNPVFIAAWQKHIQRWPGLEALTINSPKGGPPGKPVEISLSGAPIEQLKAASEWLKEQISGVNGVLAAEDNTAYGREQLIYKLLPAGRAAGLNNADIGRQLRAGFAGYLVQIHQVDGDEVEVRARLPKAERDRLANLSNFPIRLPNSQLVPLEQVVKFETRRGFEVLRHSDAKLAVKVGGDIDEEKVNANEINASLKEQILPEMQRRFGGIQYKFEGREQLQQETMGDMGSGAILAFFLIYIVLAWVFSSYAKPIVVMSVIPFAIIGAIVGHWVIGLNMTLMSMFGFFALSGIVVNDSIVLVTFYQQLRERNVPVKEALIDAACLRLRAVMLTSLTTIAGLMPLLFETSLQAMFLVPMAAALTFGLGFGTLLVLLVVPAALGSIESIQGAWGRWTGSAYPKQWSNPTPPAQ